MTEPDCCRNPTLDPGHTRAQRTCGTCGADWPEDRAQVVPVRVCGMCGKDSADGVVVYGDRCSDCARTWEA